MLKKLFGGKKQDGFFLDLGGETSPPSETSAPKAPEAAAPKADTPEPAAPAVAPPVTPASAAAPAVVAEPVPQATAAPVEPAAPAEPEPEPAEPLPTNFATTYLKPSGRGISRRRPSSNMSGFLDMARSVRR